MRSIGPCARANAHEGLSYDLRNGRENLFQQVWHVPACVFNHSRSYPPATFIRSAGQAYLSIHHCAGTWLPGVDGAHGPTTPKSRMLRM